MNNTMYTFSETQNFISYFVILSWCYWKYFVTSYNLMKHLCFVWKMPKDSSQWLTWKTRIFLQNIFQNFISWMILRILRCVWIHFIFYCHHTTQISSIVKRNRNGKNHKWFIGIFRFLYSSVIFTNIIC